MHTGVWVTLFSGAMAQIDKHYMEHWGRRATGIDREAEFDEQRGHSVEWEWLPHNVLLWVLEALCAALYTAQWSIDCHTHRITI